MPVCRLSRTSCIVQCFALLCFALLCFALDLDQCAVGIWWLSVGCADQLEFVLTKLRAEVDSLDKDGWVFLLLNYSNSCID